MRSWLVVCALILFCVGESLSAAPKSVSVQGRLTDSLGVPLPAGMKGFLFRIFDAPTGGTEIWSGEDQFLPTDSEGLWSAQVGALVGLTDAVFADTVRWLDININGTQLPRVRLVTGPYAHRVSTVDGAAGGAILSKIAIGPGNTNAGDQAFVAGEANSASGDHSVISGGEGNRATGAFAVVAGGEHNRADGDHSFVGGGGGFAASDSNLASAEHAAVVGGRANRATSAQSFIGAGSDNTVTGLGSFSSSVLNGQRNDVSGLCATVVGGRNNKASGSMTFVGGGGHPSGGADSNVAAGTSSAVVCGMDNTAMDSCTFVGAGRGNDATGKYAVIPGGLFNVASGSFSFAAGLRAKANHTGAFVWADVTDADFASSANNQFLIRASGGVGIGNNGPEGPLHVFDGSAGTVTASPNSSAVFEDDISHYISLLSPDNTERGILFGSPANELMGSIRFNVSTQRKGFHFRTGNNAITLVLDSCGNLTADGNVVGSGLACPSDARFKRNIETIPNALDLVGQLRGVRYEWKRETFAERNFPEGQQVGLIAQDVREVVPQAVIEQSDGYLAVDYARLMPLLIEGMKEQQRTIDELKERLARLESRP